MQKKLPFYDHEVDCYLDNSIFAQKPGSEKSKKLLSYLCWRGAEELTNDVQSKIMDAIIDISQLDKQNRYLWNFTFHIFCIEK